MTTKNNIGSKSLTVIINPGENLMGVSNSGGSSGGGEMWSYSGYFLKVELMTFLEG